ncbi:MAG: hypothetical protein MJZ43_01525 [Bacteroidaceae bacterium]|nr:hypothetical protein [Bacteroidaceae bacterium]
MKRFLTFLALCCLMAAGAWAQSQVQTVKTSPAADGTTYYLYTLESGNNAGKYWAAPGGMLNAQSLTSTQWYFETTGTDGVYYVRDYGTGKYLYYSTGNKDDVVNLGDTKSEWTVQVHNDSQKVTLSPNGKDNIGINYSSNHIVYDAAKNGNPNSWWKMCEYEGTAPAEKVSVTYVFTNAYNETVSLTDEASLGSTATAPSVSYLSNATITDEDKVVSATNTTFHVSGTWSFPFQESKYYTMKSNSNNYVFDGTNAWYNNSVAVANHNDLWQFEHVSGTLDLYKLKTYSGKYAVLSGSGRIALTFADTPTEWESGTGATSYFRVVAQNGGFDLQHPGDAETNVGSHVDGMLGSWKAGNSPTNGASINKVEEVTVTPAVVVPSTLNPASGNVEASALATITLQFTGEDVEQQGLIPMTAEKMGETPVYPTLTKGTTVITATSIALNEETGLNEITFLTTGITDGEWILSIPEGAFWVWNGELGAKAQPVAKITATYTVATAADPVPTAGKVYTIKAHFTNTTYNDLYLSSATDAEQLLVPMETTATANQSYWVAEDSGNTDRPWKFKSGYGYAKYLDWQNGGLSANGDNFNVTACETEVGTYHLNVSTNDRHIGTWGNNNDTKKGFGAVGSGGCWSQNHVHNNGANSNWTTDYIIEEVKNVDVYTVTGTGSVGVTNIPGGYTYASAVAAGGVIIVPAGTTLTNANFTESNVNVTINSEAKTITLSEMIVSNPTSLDQIEQGIPYTISTFNRGSMIYTENGLSSTVKENVTVNPNDPNQQFLFIKDADNYYFYSVGGGKFLKINGGKCDGSDVPANTPLVFDESTGEKKADFPVVINLGGKHVGISNGYTPGVITTWKSTSDGGNMVRLTPVLDTTIDVEAIIHPEVTYTIYVDDTEVGTVTKKETVGQAPSLAVPSYVTASDMPEVITLSTTAVAVHSAYNSQMPFDFENTYRMTLHGKNIRYESSSNHFKLEATADGDKTSHFRMGGDWLNGFTFYNVDAEKYVSYGDAFSDNKFAEGSATCTEVGAKLELFKSGNNFYLRGVASNGSYIYVNDNANAGYMKTWTGADGGSLMTFAKVEEYLLVIVGDKASEAVVTVKGAEYHNGETVYVVGAVGDITATAYTTEAPYYVYTTSVDDEAKTITVTYKTARAVKFLVGEPVNKETPVEYIEFVDDDVTEPIWTPNIAIPDYVDVTSEVVTADPEVYNVKFEYNSLMPFVPGELTTVDINVIDHYYFHVEEREITFATGTDDPGTVEKLWVPCISPKAPTFDDDAAYIWRMEGDWYNGFRFHNDQLAKEGEGDGTACHITFRHKEVATGNQIPMEGTYGPTSKTEMEYKLVSVDNPTANWDKARATLTGDPDDQYSYFDLVHAAPGHQTQADNPEWQFRVHGTGEGYDYKKHTGIYLNFRNYPDTKDNPDSLLCLYNAAAFSDRHSSFTFHKNEVCTEDDRQAVLAMIDAIEKGAVGAILDKTAQEYQDLLTLKGRIENTTIGCTRALFDIYTEKLVKYAGEKKTPADGEAYRLAVRTKEGRNFYLKDDGTYTTDSLDAAIYVLGSSADGTKKILAGNNNAALYYFRNGGLTQDVYAEGDCDFNYELMAGKETVADVLDATGAAKYATVCLTDGNGKVATMASPDKAVTGGDCEWEAQDVVYMNDDLSSAIVMEPVPYPYNKPKFAVGSPDDHEGGYASIWLPYPMIFPDGVEVYRATDAESDGLLVLKKVNTDRVVAAGGYIIRDPNKASTMTVLPAPANPDDVEYSETNAFVGSTENPLVVKEEGSWSAFLTAQGNPTGTPYVLAKKNEGIGYYKYNAGTDDLLPKGKAIWFSNYKADSSSDCLRFSFGDIVEAIKALNGEATDAEIYDLQGHRLNKAVKGQINVINGKKVMFK